MSGREHSKSNTVENLFICTSLALYLLFSMTYLRQTAVLAQVDFVIKLAMPVAFIVLPRAHRLPPNATTVLALYASLALYTTVIGLFSELPSLVLLNTARYLYPLLFLAGLCLILRPMSFSLSVLTVIPYLGALFAIQTIIVFVGVQSGHPPPSDVAILDYYKSAPFRSYGWLGFGEGTRAAGTGLQVYRAQSFFLEPTRLASFLESAIILGYGLYRVTRHRTMLMCALLATIAFILTFSTTGYIVMFATSVCLVLTKNRYKLGSLTPLAWTIAVGVIVIVTITYLNTIDSFYGADYSQVNMAFGKPSKDLMSRIGYLQDSMRLFWDHPLGIGVIGVEQSGVLQNYLGAGDVLAPLVWLRIAGAVGLALQLGVLFVASRIALRRASTTGIERYIGLAFIATVLHHCVAGDWFDTKFFFLLACVLVTDSFRFSTFTGLKNLRRSASACGVGHLQVVPLLPGRPCGAGARPSVVRPVGR